MVRENNHPYIVAYGSSKRDISKFYIEVEKHVMAVIIITKFHTQLQFGTGDVHLFGRLGQCPNKDNLMFLFL